MTQQLVCKRAYLGIKIWMLIDTSHGMWYTIFIFKILNQNFSLTCLFQSQNDTT